MSENKPLVSVFIPYYNDEKFLSESINSVLKQTYTNFELILLNHACTDSSRKISHSFTDPRIKHIDMPKNYGAGGGILFSELIKTVKGKYIKPLCADDLLLPDAIENCVNYMENNPEISFSFGNVVSVDENLNPLGIQFFEPYGFNVNNTNIDELLLFKKCIGHSPYPASFIKTEDVKDLYCDKVLIMEFDMSIWLHLLLKGKNIGFVNKDVCLYRLHTGQMSNDGSSGRITNINLLEIPMFLNIFYTLQSVDILKKVFFDSKYINMINDEDIEFIPFIIAEYYASLEESHFKITGYLKLYELLNKESYRLKLEEKFNYTVADFRALYSKSPMYNINPPVQSVLSQEKKINKLFSINKTEDRKTIYILGIKFSYKRGRKNV